MAIWYWYNTTKQLMKTIVSILIMVSAIWFAGCDGTASQNEGLDEHVVSDTPRISVEEEQEPEPEESYSVGDKKVGLKVEPDMQIQDLGDFLLVCSSEVVHDAQCFTLEEYEGDKKLFMGWKQRQLSPQRSIYFKMDEMVVYDGVKERELEGYFNIGTGWFKVTSGASATMDQPDPDPKWCFPYLIHVELEQAL